MPSQRYGCFNFGTRCGGLGGGMKGFKRQVEVFPSYHDIYINSENIIINTNAFSYGFSSAAILGQGLRKRSPR